MGRGNRGCEKVQGEKLKKSTKGSQPTVGGRKMGERASLKERGNREGGVCKKSRRESRYAPCKRNWA